MPGRLIVATCALTTMLMFACSDGTGPSDDYPGLAGSYVYSAKLSGSVALRIMGTVTISQEVGGQEAFEGEYEISWTRGNAQPDTIRGMIANGHFTTQDSVAFDFDATGYRHTATYLEPGVILGDWTRAFGDSTETGDFVMTRGG